MVASGTRNARAIAATSSPASVRSASATCASRLSAGWQQVNTSRSMSSRTELSGSTISITCGAWSGTWSGMESGQPAAASLAGRAASRRRTS